MVASLTPIANNADIGPRGSLGRGADGVLRNIAAGQRKPEQIIVPGKASKIGVTLGLSDHIKPLFNQH